MKEKPTTYSKLPLPWNWDTCVDGLGLLGVQCEPKIAPEAEVYFLETHISYRVGKYAPPAGVIKTMTGKIQPPPPEMRQVVPFVSSTYPADRVYTQKEVLDDIMAYGIGAGLALPEVGGVIDRQCLRVDRKYFVVPPELEEQGYLEGCTHVLIDNEKCSSWPGIYKRMNLQFPSVTKYMRNELVYNQVLLRSGLPKSPRMRNVLQMRAVLGMDVDNGKVYPYTKILTNDITETVFSEELSKSLSKNKFFKSVASPISIPGVIVDESTDLRIYEFLDWNFPGVLKLGPEWKKK